MNQHEFPTLGNNVRKLRQGRRLSQESFAELCDVHRTYISDVENGVRNVTIGTLLKIAQGLGTTVSELTRNVEQDVRSMDNSGAAPIVTSLKLIGGVLVLFLASASMHAQSLLEGLDLETADAAYILQTQTSSNVSPAGNLTGGNTSVTFGTGQPSHLQTANVAGQSGQTGQGLSDSVQVSSSTQSGAHTVSTSVAVPERVELIHASSRVWAAGVSKEANRQLDVIDGSKWGCVSGSNTSFRVKNSRSGDN